MVYSGKSNNRIQKRFKKLNFPISFTYSHTHTHTRARARVCVCVCVCVHIYCHGGQTGVTAGVTGRVHQWLSSYLRNRTHRVKIGKSLSNPKAFYMGIPQGSVLGPSLFPIYYQPVTDIIKKHGCCYHGYADDMQIYARFKPADPAGLLDAINKAVGGMYCTGPGVDELQ